MSRKLDWFEELFDRDKSGDLDWLERASMFGAMDEIDQEMAERAKSRSRFSTFNKVDAVDEDDDDEDDDDS